MVKFTMKPALQSQLNSYFRVLMKRDLRILKFAYTKQTILNKK